MKATLYEALGISAGRLRRGGPGGAASTDPQVLREDAGRPGQRRRGAALHQSCQPHTERPRSPRSLRRGTRGVRPAPPSSASRTSSAMRSRRPASRPTCKPPRAPSPNRTRSSRRASTPTERSGRAQLPSPRADRARRVVRALDARHRRSCACCSARSSPPRSCSSRRPTRCWSRSRCWSGSRSRCGPHDRLRHRPRRRVVAPPPGDRLRRRCSSRRPISRSSTGAAKRACSSAPTSRRRTRAGSSSCAWPSSSGRKPGARASRGPGIVSAARLFDYAMWGLVLALLLSELRGAGIDAGKPRVLARPSAARAGAHHRQRGCRSRHCSSRRCRRRRASGCSAATCSSRFRTPTRGATSRSQLRSRAAARVPRLVGGRGLRLPAARADSHRRRLRKGRAEPGDRLGFRAGLPRHARAARAYSTR